MIENYLGLRGLYIGPFGARAGNAEMTLDAVVTFGGEDEDDEDCEDDVEEGGHNDDDDADDGELPLIC